MERAMTKSRKKFDAAFKAKIALEAPELAKRHNTYRVSDRVSQYLIREVQARSDRPQTPREVFFRTMLFKFFNRIETWEALEQRLGPLVWSKLDSAKLDQTLEELRCRGRKIYSAAYIMP